MKKGKVKFYNPEKGFGFIVEHETGKDIFVHATGLQEDIHDDDEVMYDTKQGKKGLNAVSVRKL